MNIDGYINSYFYDSKFCNSQATKLSRCTGAKMYYFAKEGNVKNIAARIAAPFVGGGTLLASLCLRIASVIEPIIGLFADIGVGICTGDKRPLNHSKYRVAHLVRNLIGAPLLGIKDVLLMGVIAGVGGVIFPKFGYYSMGRH